MGDPEDDDPIRALDQIARALGRPSSADPGMAEASEFDDALHLLVMLKKSSAMVAYLRSDKPIPPSGRQALATWIEDNTPQRPRGHPPGPVEGPVREAERLAAQYVRYRRAEWQTQHPDRKRMSSADLTPMIAEAIKMAARLTGVVEGQITVDRVRNQLGLK